MMKMSIACLLLFGTSLSPAHAGPLRERIKDRWVNKQKQGSTPVAREDLSTQLGPGDYTFKISSEGQVRYYKLHVPPSYNSKIPTALIFALHGGGGNMEIQANDEYYGQISKSNSAGYIVAFPNGVSPFPSGKIATWNAGACCGQARDSKSEDVQFFRNLVKTVQGQLNIDAKKIYAIGMSNGGMMSYRLACEMSDVFAGIASVAGTDNTLACQPKNPVSILHIHAKNDDHVLYNGGAGEKAFRDKSAVTDFSSVSSTIEKWKKLNGCEGPAKKILEKTGAFCEQYRACRAGSSVQLCVTEDGGHSWPGGKKPRAQGGASPTKSILANDIIWDFFQTGRLFVTTSGRKLDLVSFQDTASCFVAPAAPGAIQAPQRSLQETKYNFLPRLS